MFVITCVVDLIMSCHVRLDAVTIALLLNGILTTLYALHSQVGHWQPVLHKIQDQSEDSNRILQGLNEMLFQLPAG